MLDSVPYVIDKIFIPKQNLFEPKGFIFIKGFGSRIREEFEENFQSNKNSFADCNELNQVTHLKNCEKKIVDIVESDFELQKVLKKTLRYPRFDIAYFFNTRYIGNTTRNSQYWHHDSVGRRLKIFVCDEDQVDPSIEIESNSSHVFSGQALMRKEERELYEPKNSVNQIMLNPIDALIFDTNYMHRGIGETKNGTRRILVLEFSNYLKSYCRGKVGKRRQP